MLSLEQSVFLLDAQSQCEKNFSFRRQTALLALFNPIERQWRNPGQACKLRFAQHLRFANFFYVILLSHWRKIPAGGRKISIFNLLRIFPSINLLQIMLNYAS
jgi:hypothetical protein